MANSANHSTKKILAGVIAAATLVLPAFALAARTSIDWVNLSGTTYIQPNYPPNGVDLLILGANHYINFNAVTGSSGYGFRDNAGVMEFKNSGGSWTGVGTGGSGTSGVATSSLTATYPLQVTPTSATINFSLLNMATTTATCSGSVSCPQFVVIGSSPVAIIGTASSGYPFGGAGNSTSTLTQFNGGLTAYSTSTIGSGGANGLTINGNATTTGLAYFAGNVGIGTSTPYSRLTLWGPDTSANTSSFLIANSASSTLLSVDDLGDLLVGNYISATSTAVISGLASGAAVSPITFGSGSTGAAFIFNDISGAREALTTGGFNLTFNHQANNGTYYPTLQILGGSGTQGSSGYNFNLLNGNVAMALTSAGNLGIATTTPANLLTIGSTTPNSIQLNPYANGTSTFSGGIQMTDINETGSATSTFNNGINISSGCFSIANVCVGGSNSGVSTVSGAWPILSSGGTTPVISWGGISTSSNISTSQILYATGGNTFAGVATSTLTPSSPLTGSFIQIGSSGSIGCQTASGSQAGCLSSTDWTTFNNKGSGSVTSVATNASLSGGTITTTGTLSLNLGNSNWWTARQNFTNASTSMFTATSSVWFTNLATPAGTFLAVDPNGLLIATSTPSGSNSAFSPAANYATTGTLPAYTYLTGVITEVSNGALSVDGANPSVGQIVLVKNETGACTSSSGGCNNGLYNVTAAGSGIAAFVLTRNSQYNSSSNVIPGIITYVISGTVNNDDFWALTTAAPITVGTTGLTYTEVSGGGASVTSVSNSDSTLTISPTAGAVVASLNLSHANTWAALQMFSNASSTLFSNFGTAYFGGSATSSFGSNGQLTLQMAAGTGNGAVCATSGGLLEYESGANCVAGQNVAGSEGQIQYNESGNFGATSQFVFATSTNQLLIGTSGGSPASIELFSNTAPPAEYDILRPAGTGGSNHTLTIPDVTGTFALGTGTNGDCAQWTATNVLGAALSACGSGGITWPWNILTNYGTTTNATTTPYWAQEGIYASSTSYFVNASINTSGSTNNSLSVGGTNSNNSSAILVTDGTGGTGERAITANSTNASGYGIFASNSGNGVGIFGTNSSTGVGGLFTNSSTGLALSVTQGNTSLLIASTTLLSSYGPAYFGATATSTFTSTGWLGMSSSTPWSMLSLSGGAITVAEASTSAATTQNINWTSQQTFKIEMTQNETINMNHDGVPGQVEKGVICQDGTGSRLVTWASSSSIVWSGGTPPILTTTAFACDVVSFITTGATGTVEVLGAATPNFP